MAGQGQQGSPQKPASGVRPPAATTATPPPGPKAPAQQNSNPAAPRPVSPGGTGKFAPVSTGKFTPVSPASGPRPAVTTTGKFAPVGSAPKPVAAGAPKLGAAPPRSSTPPPPPFQKPNPVPARPRSAPPPGASGRLSSISATVSVKPGAKAGGQWTCSSCAKALGPQSVMLGTGIILEGNLICVECVKSGKKRAKATIPPSVIWGSAGGLAAVLGVCAIFVPGQVLMVTLLLSVCGLLVGAIGFTLSSVARLATIAVALCAGAGSVYGLLVVRERAQDRAADAQIAVEAERIKDYLKHDAVMEAVRQLNTLDDRAQKADSGLAAPAAQKRLAELHQSIDAWFKANFGELSSDEQTLLSLLYRQVGSLTSNSARRFRAIKLTDKSLHMTVAVNPTDAVSAGNGPPPVDAVGQQALPIAQTVARVRRDLDEFEIRLVAATPGSNDVKDLMTLTLDSETLAGLRTNDSSLFMQALPSYTGPKRGKNAPRDASQPDNTKAPTPPADMGPPPGVKIPSDKSKIRTEN